MMKSAEEVLQAPEKAMPMELAVASIEKLSTAVRMAVDQNDRPALHAALSALKRNVEMVERWISEVSAQA